MTNPSYKIARLDDKPEAVEHIREWERLLSEQIGVPVALIAYTSSGDGDPVDETRLSGR
ncbi:hypothetical protein IJ21_39830 [Paenibacillus sp. 32O-W]|uniref:hypothetical protein n=1 Tax=Paenibacillus sp. 32O-W TaxID=1695218 RepID=UPI00071EB8BA|nr:hypothetical protein [Paenibacillus sp. 32O-W]ALS29369.1 hypothetical protein IJ21_39830 [Paenibacillus sp. 32O-W]